MLAPQGQPSHPELYLRNFDVCGHQVAGGVDRIVPDQVGVFSSKGRLTRGDLGRAAELTGDRWKRANLKVDAD